MPTLSWNALSSQQLDPAGLPRFDPYLRIADATGFIDHFDPLPADLSLPVSVELQAMAGRPTIAGMTVPVAYPLTSRWFTARVSVAALNALLHDAAVARVQLGEGVLPQRPSVGHATPWSIAAPTRVPPSPPGHTDLLLGVIDAGCPFAHADLCRPVGGGSRVVRLWDQDGGIGTTPRTMGYGGELTDADLNAMIARATDAHGKVDEHACYLMAGADQVVRRTSHGAHALGLLAALRRYDGRPNRDNASPVHGHAGDASAADIAFVQLPRKLLDAAFPPAIEHHVLDGLRYLLSAGCERGVNRIAVSFGFESWLGPHDGTSWFGLAVQDLVRQARDDHGIALQVYFIASNAGSTYTHLQLVDEPQPEPSVGRQATVHWQLLPDGQAPTHIEIWMPNESVGLADLVMEIAPPGHDQLEPLHWGDAKAWPTAASPALCVVMDRSRVLGSAADVIVLRLSPTRVYGSPYRAAPTGEWSLKLSATTSLNGINIYIGRGTAHMGSPRRGRQAELSRRGISERQADRHGTLNGFANHPSALVATACVAMSAIYGGRQSPLQPGHAAPYAGTGPSRDRLRAGPNFGVAVEHGIYHRGFIGIGNRSATTFRLIGTSVSAPLGARMVLDGEPCDAAVPGTAYPGKPFEVGNCEFDPSR